MVKASGQKPIVLKKLIVFFFSWLAPVVNDGVNDVYNASYRPETGGFLPIPETEVRLSNDVIKQNPGWE